MKDLEGVTVRVAVPNSNSHTFTAGFSADIRCLGTTTPGTLMCKRQSELAPPLGGLPLGGTLGNLGNYDESSMTATTKELTLP